MRTRGTNEGLSLPSSFHSLAAAGNSDFQPGPYLHILRHQGLGPQAARDLDGLAAERDPELFFSGLNHFAGRELERQHPESAALAYQVVAEAALAFPELSAQARQRFEAMQGVGATGARVEFLLRDIVKQSSDPAMLGAMGMAGLTYKLVRLGSLTRLAASPTARAWLSPGARSLAASLTGFAVEAPTFTLTARGANEALGRSQDWSSAALGRDLASGALVLGGLKIGGATSAAFERGLVRRLPTLLRPSTTPFQQGGMLAGIYLGHGLEQAAGLKEKQSGATTFADSLMTLLQFNIAGRLTPSFLTRDLTRIEMTANMQNTALGQTPLNPPLPPLFQRGEMVPASVSPPFEKRGPGGIFPMVVLSSSHDEGGKNSSSPPPLSPGLDSARSSSSKPPVEHGQIARDALIWGSRQARSAEDVTRMAHFVDRIRVEMWNALNLHVDKPLARALGQGKVVYVRTKPIDGSLDSYQLELSALPTPREVHPDYVEFTLDTNQGRLTLHDIVSQAAEFNRLKATGVNANRSFLGYYRSLLDFESSALQSPYLVAAMPANVRALVLQQATNFLRPAIVEQPVVPLFVRRPEVVPKTTPLTSYFPYVAELARQEVESYAANAGIHGKHHDRLQSLVQKLLVGLHERESQEPRMIRYAILQARLKPDPETPGKRIIEILTPKESLGRPVLTNEVIFNILRHPSSLGEPFAFLHHVILNTGRDGKPIEADLRFQEALGISFNLKVRLESLSLETFDAAKALQWMKDNGYAE